MQQQTVEDGGPQRGGLLRRIFPDFTAAPSPTPQREDGRVEVPEAAPPAPQPAPRPQPTPRVVQPARVVEARPIRNPDLESIALRIDRLEQGTRLLAETIKRAFGELSTAIDAARRDASTAMPTAVDEAVTRRLEPVAASLQELTRTIERFPRLLASSTDAVMGQVDRSARKAQQNLIHAMAMAAAGSPVTPPDELPPKPFELEPVEPGSIDGSDERMRWASREAAAIWGSA